MRSVLERAPRCGRPMVLCSKGIEERTGELLHHVARDACPGGEIAVLSGPTFAHEVAAGLPTAVTLACEDREIGEALRERIGHQAFRTYLTDDVVGAEIGGAIKNVLAIACGVVEGAGLGQNARAALIARGFIEMTRFGVACGAPARNARGPVGPWRPGADLHLGQLAQFLAWARDRSGPAGRRAAGGPPDGGRGRVHGAGSCPAGARKRRRHADRRGGRALLAGEAKCRRNPRRTAIARPPPRPRRSDRATRSPKHPVEGLGARQAALRMLDGVLAPRPDARSRGIGLARLCRRPTRRWRVAIAGETLRRLPDLDALIDGSTRLRLPDDSQGPDGAPAGAGAEDRPRNARPCGGRDRACRWSTAGRGGWSTACSAPCFGAECRASRSRAFPKPSRIAGAPPGARKSSHAARRQIVRRPPLDLSFADDAEAQAYAAAHGGVSLAPGHVRARKLLGHRTAGLRRGTLVGAGPRRLASRAPDPARRGRSARPVRRAGRQDDAARRGRPRRDVGRRFGQVGSAACARISTARIWPPSWSKPMPWNGNRTASMTRSCSTRPARRRARSAAIPKCSTARGLQSSRTMPSSRRSWSSARRDG